MSDISLTASMRSNLLSLQNTAELMDRTQERLSTGKKVNSALDNPSSYYTARSLDNRAGDLNSLMDSMGQGIATVKAASEAIESITSFVEQAKAVANTAREQPSREITTTGEFSTTDAEKISHRFSLDGEEFVFASVESGAGLEDGIADFLTNKGFTDVTASYDNTTGKMTIEAKNAGDDVTTSFDAYSFKLEAGGSPVFVDATGLDTIDEIIGAINTQIGTLTDAEGNTVAGVSVEAVEDKNGNVAGFKLVSANATEVKISGEAFGLKAEGTAGSTARINYMKQYNALLEQVTDMAKDSSYKGVNLLQKDNLTVIFNEDRSSKLVVNGKDASAQGLGLTEVNDWSSNDGINNAITATENAIESLRSMASEFGNNYSILQTREDFTESLINVLEEGSDKLTLADMNEESANMLALQTRQQLAVNSLSLASQASQSILQLFS